MESIENLRNWAREKSAIGKRDPLMYFDALVFADDIEAEIERDYMKLPVDADGVPIHVGDDMVSDMQRGVVTSVNEKAFFINYGTIGCNIKTFHHVKPRTLEDIVQDAIQYGYSHGRAGMDVSEQRDKYAAEIREMFGGDAE